MRGAVTFTADGQERVLQFTTNRLCKLEEKSGRTVMDFAEKLGEPGGLSFVDIRLLMQIGMGAGLHEDTVGDLIDEIGLQKAVTLVATAFAAAFDVQAAGASGAGKMKAGAA